MAAAYATSAPDVPPAPHLDPRRCTDARVAVHFRDMRGSCSSPLVVTSRRRAPAMTPWSRARMRPLQRAPPPQGPRTRDRIGPRAGGGGDVSQVTADARIRRWQIRPPTRAKPVRRRPTRRFDAGRCAELLADARVGFRAGRRQRRAQRRRIQRRRRRRSRRSPAGGPSRRTHHSTQEARGSATRPVTRRLTSLTSPGALSRFVPRIASSFGSVCRRESAPPP